MTFVMHGTMCFDGFQQQLQQLDSGLQVIQVHSSSAERQQQQCGDIKKQMVQHSKREHAENGIEQWVVIPGWPLPPSEREGRLGHEDDWSLEVVWNAKTMETRT